MIYFLKADKRIKIGYANDPSLRIPSIQTSSPYELEVLLIIEGNYDTENELHKKFQKYRASGEWFEYSEKLKLYIKENQHLDRKFEFGFILTDFAGNDQVLRLRKRHKLTLEGLGDKLNITTQSVKEIQDREKAGTISINVLENVAKVLGYKLEYRFTPLIVEQET